MNVQIDAPAKDKITITVMDGMGRTAKTLQAAVEAGSNTVAVDVSNIPAGNYLLSVTCEGNCQPVVRKFVKE